MRSLVVLKIKRNFTFKKELTERMADKYKKSVIYNSSQDDLMKILVLILTLGISIMVSMVDYKSCYATILVQACNNMYDFYKYTNNKKYTTLVKRESITIMICSIFAIILSVVAMIDLYDVMKFLWMKLFVLLFVTIPLIVVYNDYKINVRKENELEI